MLLQPAKATAAEVAAADLAGVDAVGVASEDAVARLDRGTPLRSPVAWVAVSASPTTKVRCSLSLNGTVHYEDRGGAFTPGQEDRFIGWTKVMEGTATVNGLLFEGSGTDERKWAAGATLVERWTVKGTLSPDRAVCTALTFTVHRTQTDTRPDWKCVVTTDFTVTLGPVEKVPDEPGLVWSSRAPKVQAVAYKMTRTDEVPATETTPARTTTRVEDDFQYNGQGEAFVRLD
jgi:hypothetical protein